MFDRTKTIELLLNDDINYIKRCIVYDNDSEYIDSILSCGFKGYLNYSDSELILELDQRNINND